MDEKLLEVINHYGILPQLKYFQSEVFELNEAIIAKEIMYQSSDTSVAIDRFNLEHIIEEISDVAVMLLQFKEYYHIDGDEILRIMNKKIDRQLERIKNEKDN